MRSVLFLLSAAYCHATLMSNSSENPLPRLILASASPRRRELLALLGLPFAIVPSRYEEPTALDRPGSLEDFVRHLAAEKAREVAKRSPSAWIVGADTEVALDLHAAPFGKPADADDAARMLRLLAGREHLVSTGVALLHTDENAQVILEASIAVTTRVRFRALTDAMIADYVATGEPLDKAGAYGAQGYAAPFIESFHGDFFNVVGLPLCAVGKLLEENGLVWWQVRPTPPPIDA